MQTRPVRLALLCGIVALALAAGLTGAAAADTADQELVEPCAATPPDDFADPEAGNDAIGWFDGYWYNEPLDIDASDGITEDELEELSARTAARFEAMRCLTFEEVPPVEIVTREEFGEETSEEFDTVDDASRQFDNALMETLLLVGDEEDSTDVREEDRSASVGGYYDFVEERIVVVSDDPDSLALDEGTLAHELGHALQDQHFDLETYVRDTNDRDKGKLGVIEGDVHRVEHQYLDHCAEERWSEPCITDGDPTDEAGDGDEAAGEPPSWGLYFMQFQPYSDGPNFVDHVYEEGGWDAVDDLYDEMPQHSIEIISPEKYGSVDVEELEVRDESDGDWERLAAGERSDHEAIGQGGLSAILMDPAYDGAPVIPPNAFLNYVGFDELHPTNPLNFDHAETGGWRGDRLYAYGNDAGETGTVWKLAWNDSAEAERFAATYEELIEVRGGEGVDDYPHTYEFGEDSEFDMVQTLVRDDDRLWIATAPTVDELSEIHGGLERHEGAAAWSVGDEEGDSTGGDDDGTDADGTDADGTDADADGSDDGDDDPDAQPGFGLVVALGAVLAAALASRRR